MEVGGQVHAPAASPSGRSRRYLLDRRLDRPQSRSGRDGEEKKLTSVNDNKVCVLHHRHNGHITFRRIHMIYEGAFKSFRTESITK
jgi:hypothetical protein